MSRIIVRSAPIVSPSSAIAGVGGPSYDDSFSIDSNPLSSPWVHLDSFFYPVEAASGNAQGTGPGNSGGEYLDAYAYLGGMGFPPDQYASGIVRKGSPSDFMEIELLLRWSDTSNSTQGYECYLHQDGDYCTVTRWTGATLTAPAGIGYFDEIDRVTGVTAPQDGDLYEAFIVGDIITVKLNGVTLITVDVSSGGRTPIATGDPGIGFDRNAGDPAYSEFCFKSFSARSL